MPELLNGIQESWKNMLTLNISRAVEFTRLEVRKILPKQNSTRKNDQIYKNFQFFTKLF
jgi:hypothetical protein